MAKHKAVKPTRTQPQPQAHARAQRHHSTFPTIPVVTVSTLLILLIGTWFLPAQYIPIPKTIDTCIITSGGTLRLHTQDCGTLLYRGHISLQAGDHVQAVHTGPIAWQITRIEQPAEP